MVQKIEKSNQKKFSSLVKDKNLSEKHQKLAYEPYEKIFEIFVETLVEIDFGVISLYDENNKIIITLSLADLKYEAVEKYPYDMFYLNLINMKNVKVYAHENTKQCESPTKLLNNILSTKKTKITHEDELLNQIPA